MKWTHQSWNGSLVQSGDADQVLGCVIGLKIWTCSDPVIRYCSDNPVDKGEILIISLCLNSVSFRGNQAQDMLPPKHEKYDAEIPS